MFKKVFCLAVVILVNGSVFCDGGANTLVEAIEKNDFQLFSKLVEAANDFNATTDDGSTALHFAAAKKDGAPFVKLLLEKGAKANVKNIYGYKPMDYAAQQHNLEIAKLLSAAAKTEKTSVPAICATSSLAAKELNDVWQIRNEVDPTGTATNVVFACRLDFLSKLMSIYRPPTVEALVNYRDTSKGNVITINQQDIGAPTIASAIDAIPAVEVIYSPDGTMPVSKQWGTVPMATDPVVQGNGSGLMAGQRGRFDDTQNYVTGGLSTDEAAQSKLFVVPSLSNYGNVTAGATSIREAIEVALHQSPLAKYSNCPKQK